MDKQSSGLSPNTKDSCTRGELNVKSDQETVLAAFRENMDILGSFEQAKHLSLSYLSELESNCVLLMNVVEMKNLTLSKQVLHRVRSGTWWGTHRLIEVIQGITHLIETEKWRDARLSLHHLTLAFEDFKKNLFFAIDTIAKEKGL
jgi:hypothetical protein